MAAHKTPTERARSTHAAFVDSLRDVRVGGRYVVEKVLGKGGMGLVVAAYYPELDQRVAVKFLLPEFAANDQLSARFLREARLAARVESPYLVRVFDVGRLETPDVPYMVMELLAGRDLREEMDERGRLSVEEAVDLVIQILLGVAQVHAHGIVHRDLKPSNVFLTKARGGVRSIKVLDFGISKQITKSGGMAGLTATEQLLGTPQYMSPDQIKASRDVDARSDVWSLGVITYELLTGKLPFTSEGDGIGALFGVIMFVDAAAPSTHRAELPAELDAVILKCLRRDPAERFSSVGELAAALEPFASRLSAPRIEEIGRTLASLRPPPSVEEPAAAAAPSSGHAPVDTAHGNATHALGPRDRSASKLDVASVASLASLDVASVASLASLDEKLAQRAIAVAPTERAPAPTAEAGGASRGGMSRRALAAGAVVVAVAVAVGVASVAQRDAPPSTATGAADGANLAVAPSEGVRRMAPSPLVARSVESPTSSASAALATSAASAALATSAASSAPATSAAAITTPPVAPPRRPPPAAGAGSSPRATSSSTAPPTSSALPVVRDRGI